MDLPEAPLAQGASPVKRGVCVIALATAFGVSAAVSAAPEEERGPIHVVTREAIRDEVNGSTILLGDVTLRQGSLQITADQVTLERVVREGDRISASGSPATVRQESASGGDPIYAEAGRILYQGPKAMLQLFDSVMVQQGNSTMRCERVDYLMNREYLRALGANGQRVQTIIPPERIQSMSKGDRAG